MASPVRKMVVVALIQARMSSNRLPGKVLHPIQGRPLLGHVIDRLRRCRTLDGIRIATSAHPSDAPIGDFAAAEGVAVHRGSLDDVAGRLLDAAIAARADGLVRISGDSPLIDPALVDRAVGMFRAERPDLVSNVVRRTFPKGQSVEVVAVAALRRACSRMTADSEREHVTPWFYAHPDEVRIVGFEADPPHGALQLSVDTIEDLRRVEAILARLGGAACSHGLDTIVAAALELENLGAGA